VVEIYLNKMCYVVRVMTIPRVAAGTVLALRIYYGLALIAAPRRPGSTPATVAVGGGAALTSIALAVAVDS
jgi:hypothetical protein